MAEAVFVTHGTPSSVQSNGLTVEYRCLNGKSWTAPLRDYRNHHRILWNWLI